MRKSKDNLNYLYLMVFAYKENGFLDGSLIEAVVFCFIGNFVP